MNFKDELEQKFTPNQFDAITSTNSNLLVSASAGSGKTAVLINRICYILEQKLANLNELLVVTFTSLASQEMRMRVKSTLEELAKKDDYFAGQLEYLNTADISTLHKFCQKVIKEYFYEIAIDPNFEIIDSSKCDYLLNECLTTLIDKNLQNNKEFVSLMLMFNNNRQDTSFKETCIKCLNYLKSKKDYNAFCNDFLEKSYSTDFKQNQVINYFNNYICDFAQSYKERIEDFVLESKKLKSESLENYFVQNSLVFEALINKSFEEQIVALNAFVPVRKVSLGKNAMVEEQELLANFEEVKAYFKTEIETFKDITLNGELEIKNNIEYVKNYVSVFVNFVLQVDQLYSQKKREENGLDFGDLEHFCLKILSNNNIKIAIQNKYKFLFVDEYQDTNEIQEEILKCVTNGNNMFMVGDVKQSIYLFRESSPQIFVNKYNTYKQNESLGKVILLNKNFRSDEQILNFSNYIFSNIMQEKTSSVDYANSAKFVFGQKFVKTKQLSPVVSVSIVPKQEKQSIKLEFPYNKFSAPLVVAEKQELKQEMLIVANEIKNLLNVKIFDQKLNAERNIKYSDIAILTRKKGDTLKTIVSQLKQEKIPCNCQMSSSIFKSYYNKVLLNYLRVLDNPLNDIAVVSVLTSFMYGISMKEMENITSRDGDFVFNKIGECVNEKQGSYEKLEKFMQDLNEIKLKMVCFNLSQLFNFIVNKFFVDEVVSFKGAEKQIALNLFKENISTFNYLSLNEYVNFITSFAQDNEIEMSINEQEDSVSVMSIHASKGLEFPVVFLVNANSSFSTKSMKEKLITNQHFGVALSEFNEEDGVERNSVIKNILKLANKQQETQEEMRLMYVALTRPKNYLRIVGTMNIEKACKIKHQSEILKRNSYLGWIVGSLPESKIESIKQGVGDCITIENNKVPISVENAKIEQHNQVDLIEERNKVLISEKQKEYLLGKKSYNNLMIKNSVTAIMNAEENDNYNIKDFRYNIKKDDDQDFLLIGNLYHLIMEKIDYKNIFTKEDVDNFLNDAVEKHLIEKNNVELVDPNKILKACEFLKSIIKTEDVVLKEKSFMMYLPANLLVNTAQTSKVLVQGVADIVIIKSDQIVLIDYKTTKFKTEKMFKEKYETQLNLYAKALQEFYEKPVLKKYIFSFYFDKPIIVWHTNKQQL